MDAGLAAVLGAVAGAVGSFGATMTTTWGGFKGTREAADREYEKNLRNLRLDAYVDLMRQVHEVRMSWWRVTEKLKHGSSKANRATLLAEADAPWSAYLAVVARLQVLIPEEMRPDLSNLARELEEMDLAGQNWLQGVQEGDAYYTHRDNVDKCRHSLLASFSLLILSNT